MLITDLPSMVVYGGFSGEAVEGDVMRIDAKVSHCVLCVCVRVCACVCVCV